MADLTKTSIEVSRNDAYNMYSCLKILASLKLSVYIKFDIGHNINKLKENFELIEDIRSNNDDIEGFADYKKGMQEISTKYFKDGKIEDPELAAAMNQELIEFKNAHPEVIEAVEQKQKELDEKTKELINIGDLTMLKLDRFPKEMELDLTPIISLIER